MLDDLATLLREDGFLTYSAAGAARTRVALLRVKWPGGALPFAGQRPMLCVDFDIVGCLVDRHYLFRVVDECFDDVGNSLKPNDFWWTEPRIKCVN